MRALARYALFATLWVIVLATPKAHAAIVDAFLKLEDIPGDVDSGFHEGWIQVSGLQFGMSHPGTNSPPSFTPLVFSSSASRALPLLMEKCALGLPIPKGRLELLRMEGDSLLFYEVDLQNITVTKADFVGTGNEELGTFALTYSRIEWTYTAYDLSGKQLSRPAAWWDLAKNEGGSIEKPVFRGTMKRGDNGKLTLSWGTTSGRLYRIMVSDKLSGPYSELQRFTATSTGATSIELPIGIGNGFFYLEEIAE